MVLCRESGGMSMKSVIITSKKYEQKARDEFFCKLVDIINIREPFSFTPKIVPLQPEDVQMVIDREHIKRADGQFILNGKFVSMEKVFDYIRENYEKIEIEIVQGQVKNCKVEIKIRE